MKREQLLGEIVCDLPTAVLVDAMKHGATEHGFAIGPGVLDAIKRELESRVTVLEARLEHLIDLQRRIDEEVARRKEEK